MFLCSDLWGKLKWTASRGTVATLTWWIWSQGWSPRLWGREELPHLQYLRNEDSTPARGSETGKECQLGRTRWRVIGVNSQIKDYGKTQSIASWWEGEGLIPEAEQKTYSRSLAELCEPDVPQTTVRGDGWGPRLGDGSVRDATWFRHIQMCFQSSSLALPAGTGTSKHKAVIRGANVTKYHNLSGLEQQKGIISRFWMPEVQNQGAGGVGSSWGLWGWIFSLSLSQPPMAYPLASASSACRIITSVSDFTHIRIKGLGPKQKIHLFTGCAKTLSPYKVTFWASGGYDLDIYFPGEHKSVHNTLFHQAFKHSVLLKKFSLLKRTYCKY